MGCMKYKVSISSSAEADLKNLALFLLQMMSIEGAYKYLHAMQLEIMSLSVLADLYHPSNFMDVRAYNPKTCHMVSHNKKWVYIFHIENDSVIIDRIRPAKLIAK